MTLALIACAFPAVQAAPEWIELPAQRHAHRAHVLGDRVLVLGGYQRDAKDDGQRDVLLYDPRSRKWSIQPSMQVPRSFFASVLIDGWVYAIGQTIERFRPGESSWETVSTDPSLPKAHFGAAAAGKKIYIVGREMQVFDTVSRKLSDMDAYPGMKPADHLEIVAFLRGSLHVIGGLDGDSFQPRRSHFVFHTQGWRKLPDAPAGLYGKFAAIEVVGDHLYYLSSTASFRYDARARKWKTLAPMPISLAMPASVYRKGWIYVLGGLPTQGDSVSLAYDVKANRWHRR